MFLDLQRLRKWLGVAIVAMLVFVGGLILYGRYRVRRAIKELPQGMGVDVKQSTEGFTLSKSEGGRTLFTISAKKAVQYQQGGHAELHDVNIVVYGRQSNRFDQIYGSDFAYNPQTGDVTAKGEVHIDLESDASGPVRPDLAPPQELKNPIHLKTSGMVFNQKTGYAATRETIEFRVPQASGTAKGATYDSKQNILTLQSAVRLKTTGADPAVITAQHGVISKEPRCAVFEVVHVERSSGDMDAEHVTVFLRPDNAVERILATGNVRAGGRGASIHAPKGEVFLGGNLVRSAVISGGVTFERGGPTPSHGSADRILLDFGAHNQLVQIRALNDVHLSEEQNSSGAARVIEVSADELTSSLAAGKLKKTQTGGRSTIVIRPAGGAAAAVNASASESSGAGTPGLTAGESNATTTITSGRFDAVFEHNRLKSLHGSPDARVVSSVAGEPDKISTSRELTVAFDAKGGITSLLQTGDFHYVEGQRTAYAQRASYSPSDAILILSGSPRVSEGGLLTTARTVRFNRKTGDAIAEGDVKTTYNEPRQPAAPARPAAGAMFSGGDPIHVTAAEMTARRATSTARFTGGARLWQGANIIQAPVITFDRARRDLIAEGSASQEISTVFVQPDKRGRIMPVNVTSARLNYSDTRRKASFEGGVVIKGSDLTLQAEHADVFLLPSTAKTSTQGQSSASQVERIVCQGHILITEPDRSARGNTLVYTPSDGKFVLTGGPPSIFDAEHGSISGDSLTFFSHDGRVVVGSSGPARTVTQTRVTK